MKKPPSINRLALKAIAHWNAREIRFTFLPHTAGRVLLWHARALPQNYNVTKLAQEANLLVSGTLGEVTDRLAELSEKPIAVGAGATIEEAITNMVATPWKGPTGRLESNPSPN